MLKKALALFTAAIWTAALTGCSSNAAKAEKIVKTNDSKISIATTLFPQYDFARQIAGDKADITLLLPPGMESHSYEPTPADIIRINKSKLFLYTGDNMEPWAKSIIEGLSGDTVVVDCSRNITLARTEEIEKEHDGHEESETGTAHEHDHEFDPHFWTDPNFAKMMVDNIAEALCRVDAVNADFYKNNADSYKNKLTALDSSLKEIAAGGTRHEIIFGGRFAFYYLTKRYGLTYEAAYDSCSTEAEPSAKKVANLISEIQGKKIPVIYYEEMVDPKVARSISEQTGAKMLILHSCHNLSKSDFEGGATYLSLMQQNAQNLKEGLK